MVKMPKNDKKAKDAAPEDCFKSAPHEREGEISGAAPTYCEIVLPAPDKPITRKNGVTARKSGWITHGTRVDE